MRILHVIQSLDAPMGGPPVICTRLAQAQAKMGHEVMVLSEGCRESNHVGKELEEIRFLFAERRSAFANILSRSLPIALKSAIACYNVLHFHGIWDPLLLKVANEGRQQRKPYVVTPHGMLDPWSLSQKKWKKRLGFWWGTRRLLDQASQLHLGNLDEVELIQPLGLATNYSVIPNGVTLSEFEPLPDRDRFRVKFSQIGDQPYILFLSRLHYKKGLDFLADAFALARKTYPSVQLIVAGPNGGEERPFRDRISKLGLTDCTHLIGAVNGRDKLELLRGASCFCLPSRQEGFSMAILEALACATPVVISENCHFPEVGESGAGLVMPLDAEAVADALLRVLKNPLQGQEMGKAGRALVEERYTWDKVAEQCESMYRKILNG